MEDRAKNLDKSKSDQDKSSEKDTKDILFSEEITIEEVAIDGICGVY